LTRRQAVPRADLKTDMKLPYTSVFLLLDCGYWGPEPRDPYGVDAQGEKLEARVFHARGAGDASVSRRGAGDAEARKPGSPFRSPFSPESLDLRAVVILETPADTWHRLNTLGSEIA